MPSRCSQYRTSGRRQWLHVERITYNTELRVIKNGTAVNPILEIQKEVLRVLIIENKILNNKLRVKLSTCMGDFLMCLDTIRLI